MPINTKTAAICLLTIVSFLSCAQPKSEQYGFVTTIGRDTLSLESITRQGNTLTSDEVDRFPILRIRHTVVNLTDDGSIRHLEMDIHEPSAQSGQRDRKVVADVKDNKVHISKTDSTGTVNRDFDTRKGVVVAHVQQMYSLYELYFAAAQKKNGTTTPLRQFYIDREFDKFPLGHADVKSLDSGKMEVTHDWLAGTGEARMDSAGDMISYSGVRTTYDVRVKRLATPPDVKGVVSGWEAKEAGRVKELSTGDSTGGKIGNTLFTVIYSRPLQRGRTLLGGLIPYDYVWRTGANAATQFTTSAPIKLAGMQVPAGKYTLFTLPHPASVELIVNKQTGEWGTEYNGAQNLGRAGMTSEVATALVEQFTISIVPKDARHGALVLEWGTFKWSAPIEVE